MHDRNNNLPADYATLAISLVIDARFSSRKQLINQIKSTDLFEIYIEGPSLSDGESIITSECVDICIIGPTLTDSKAFHFLESVKGKTMSQNCAFLAIANPGAEDADAYFTHGVHEVLSAAFSTDELFNAIIRAVVRANKSSPWEETLRKTFGSEEAYRDYIGDDFLDDSGDKKAKSSGPTTTVVVKTSNYDVESDSFIEEDIDADQQTQKTSIIGETEVGKKEQKTTVIGETEVGKQKKTTVIGETKISKDERKTSIIGETEVTQHERKTTIIGETTIGAPEEKTVVIDENGNPVDLGNESIVSAEAASEHDLSLEGVVYDNSKAAEDDFSAISVDGPNSKESDDGDAAHVVDEESEDRETSGRKTHLVDDENEQHTRESIIQEDDEDEDSTLSDDDGAITMLMENVQQDETDFEEDGVTLTGQSMEKVRAIVEQMLDGIPNSPQTAVLRDFLEESVADWLVERSINGDKPAMRDFRKRLAKFRKSGMNRY